MHAEAALARLATVTVTYQPEPAVLARQLAQLPSPALKVLVDNASAPGPREAVRALAAGRSDVLLVENADNLGLAAAVNRGVEAALARRPECEYLLLFDQDTEPGPGGVAALLEAFRQLQAREPTLGAVGPRLLDEHTGLEHGFHRISGWRWSRRFPVEEAPLRVDNVNGSGLLMPIALFVELGGLEERYFIDHVDTEWAFRLRAAGHPLYGVPAVRFLHRMGEKGLRFWLLGWRVWPYRSPTRHFFLFRNSVRLLRAPGVPGVWKLWAPVKLAITFAAHFLFDRARWQQCRQMLRGLRAGWQE